MIRNKKKKLIQLFLLMWRILKIIRTWGEIFKKETKSDLITPLLKSPRLLPKQPN